MSQRTDRQRGFTLMELMVVMAIIAVLAGIVAPGVTGTKDVSESAQSKSDRQGVQTAASNFNNASTSAGWPEAASDYAVASGGIPLYASNGTTVIAAAGATATGYRLVDFAATTDTRDSTGNIVEKTFVPDFLDRAPTSEAAMSGGVNVYLWTLKQGTSDASGQTRTVWVFKLNDAGDKYIREK
ncbi:MAG: prepilin-type N-terminal cleavage/methylation domain-containing protein [Chloroflexi bacterium]|nr:prepilin-type N-terminal cleavage/methylation domain-containing protein [Chloroflexota bacterium]